jgi:hypothetical protein
LRYLGLLTAVELGKNLLSALTKVETVKEKF